MMKGKFYVVYTLAFIMTVKILSNDLSNGLFDAIEKCDKARVEKMLALGAEVNSRNEIGLTPLMIAARNKECSIDILKMLLDKGADVNAQSEEFGNTSLMFAVNDFEKTKYLISKGADPNLPSKITVIGGGDNAVVEAISWACLTGDLRTLEFLLRNGGDVNLVLPSGDSILIDTIKSAARNRYGYDVVKMLLQYGADVNFQVQPYGDTALLEAVDYYAVDNDVKSPNAKVGKEVIKLLLEHGADPNCQRDELSLKTKDVRNYAPEKYCGGDTPLYLAKINGLKDIEELLLKYGATKTPEVNSNRQTTH